MQSLGRSIGGSFCARCSNSRTSDSISQRFSISLLRSRCKSEMWRIEKRMTRLPRASGKRYESGAGLLMEAIGRKLATSVGVREPGGSELRGAPYLLSRQESGGGRPPRSESIRTSRSARVGISQDRCWPAGDRDRAAGSSGMYRSLVSHHSDLLTLSALDQARTTRMPGDRHCRAQVATVPPTPPPWPYPLLCVAASLNQARTVGQAPSIGARS